jgi:hypothetical protein
MQIDTLLPILNTLNSSNFQYNNKNEIPVPRRELFSYPDRFVSAYLDSSYASNLKFRMKGFFLDSSIDVKIKSAPAFIFTLQRYEARETYISCFYAESYPELFKSFNQKQSESKNRIFFFD